MTHHTNTRSVSGERSRERGHRRVVPAALAVCLASLLLYPLAGAAGAGDTHVILNEVMYHPPGGRDELQFIELYNPGAATVSLSGWSLTKGAKFTFAYGTELRSKGYLVVCRDSVAFRAQYGPEANVGGAFTGRLGHKGARIELTDRAGSVVDALEYRDQAPWPTGPDGYGNSLERICPGAPSNDPANWMSSEAGTGHAAGGTPGRQNACFSALPLPVVSDVGSQRAAANDSIRVTAAVVDAGGVQSVMLAWQPRTAQGLRPWTEAPMQLESGAAQRGVYAADIRPPAEAVVIRYTVRARAASGAERLCPAATEPRPTFSCAAWTETNTARVAFLRVLGGGGIERQNRSRVVDAVVKAGARVLANGASAWGSTAVYLPAGAREPQVFDYVLVRPRKGGFKVHFHNDQPFQHQTGINVIFEKSPRWLLAEPLAYELYRAVGLPAPATEHVRFWMDDRMLGYHLVVEQPNLSFLRRNGRDANGNLYKLLWYESDLVRQHEKKNNPRTGHDDLRALVDGLNRRSGPAQWDFIQQQFEVNEVIDYFAVNMCIQNWDGFWNNYFAYHSPRPGGKWEMFPWDEDKTWGDYDGASRQYDLYTMPLTFGMNGAKVVKDSWFSSGPFGGVSWWRPPGHFSGPLLANPEFRRRFLARLREVCETTFTPARIGPAIDALKMRLEEEVVVRARSRHQDAAAALAEFRSDLQSFHNQVAHRRRFILDQLASDPSYRASSR